jgi:DNA polymerase III epsilon subunit-like protein
MVLNKVFWVVDVEGNGASPPEIIELALVEIKDMRLTGRTEYWFVKPKHLISDRVIKIHGITNADVSNAPGIEDIKEEVLSCLEGYPIVGHNVVVEVNILKRSFQDYSPIAAYDTLKLAKTLMPTMQSFGLKSLGDVLGLAAQAKELSKGAPHSALYDATLTALLFVHLLKEDVEYGALRRSDILYDPQMKLF